MLSMESMINFQAAGAGEDGRPFPSCFLNSLRTETDNNRLRAFIYKK